MPDITPAQTRIVEAYIARLRAQMLRVLASVGGATEKPSIGAIRAIRVHLTFVRIAMEECTPEHLRGYGEVPEALVPELAGLSVELEGIVSALDSTLGHGPGHDLTEKLARLPGDSLEAGSLRKLEEIVTRRGLAEFRGPLAALIDRLTAPQFEIALFGQVSCGKSSLLNLLIGQELLPVGVNPITAVPTRVVYAESPELTVWFADRQVKRFDLADLADFVSEERNPGNAKGVARIVAGVPANRLRQGVVFVDTPGLGSLATSGAAETKAYLPQCDLGVVLVNSSTTIGPEDVATIQALYEAGVQPAVVLSKADLLTPEDRIKAAEYIAGRTSLQVFPVSTVGGDQGLLDEWFNGQIAPLYEQQKTLALASIRRKIGVLREAVERALESPVVELTPERRRELEAADNRLRAAAGAITKIEKDAVRACDSLRSLAPAAIGYAARRLAEAWRGGDKTPSREIVREAIAKVARSAAGEIVEAMDSLTAQLRASIEETARTLEMTVPPVEGEGLRDLPQIDLSQIRCDPAPPFLAHFGRWAATYSAERQLRTNVEEAASAALISYGKVLQLWTRTALDQMRNRFDARADGYRAQLARMLNPVGRSPGDGDNVESDIDWLRGQS